MRVAILSDVHANSMALDRVMEELEKRDIDEVWCLGDVVGYGPSPLHCWQLLRDLAIPEAGWVVGNHDWGLLGKLDALLIKLGPVAGGPAHMAGDFSQHAWQSILQHRRILRYQNSLWEHLESLPVVASPVAGVYIVHGTFDDDADRCVTHYSHTMVAAESSYQFMSEAWSWLGDEASAADLHRSARQGWHVPRLLIVGHTHIPCVWQRQPAAADGDVVWQPVPSDGDSMRLQELDTRPAFICPGSVGFPRDGDPGCASFALLDWSGTEAEVEICRVPYAKDKTKRQMLLAGLDRDFVRQLFA